MAWLALKVQECLILNSLKKMMAEFQLCISFLSRLPFGRLQDPIPSISNACWAFPICGMIIGSITYLSYYLALYLNLSLFVSAIIALLISILITGGMHEDGLADSCDGIFGGKNKKTKLSIMRDSNIGTYGTLSLIIVFSLRVFILSEFDINFSSFLSFISIAAISRLGMLFILFYLPPVRKNGLGFDAKVSNSKSLIIGCLITLIILSLSNILGLYIIIFMTFTLLVVGYISWKNIGGQTGDICGASQQLTETVGWFVFIYLS